MKQRKAPNSPLASLPIDSVWDSKYRVVAQLGEVPNVHDSGIAISIKI